MKFARNTFLCLMLLYSLTLISQQNISDFQPDPVKESKYSPYLAARHGGTEALQEWKKNNTIQYYKELWYFTESFYIKRDHLAEGVVLNEEIIDVSRFEDLRKQAEESIVILPGFKDAMVLLPENKLKYKPAYEK
jgi:hypothetical protein